MAIYGDSIYFEEKELEWLYYAVVKDTPTEITDELAKARESAKQKILRCFEEYKQRKERSF